MLITLLFQLLTMSFIAVVIILLTELFPLDNTHKAKPKRRKG